MQKTVFDFHVKNLISGQLSIVSSIFICLYLIYLKYTFWWINNYLFWKDFSERILRNSCLSTNLFLETNLWKRCKSFSRNSMAKLDFENATMLLLLPSCQPMSNTLPTAFDCIVYLIAKYWVWSKFVQIPIKSIC